MEKPGSPPGQAANQRPRRRPRLYKHCAALARRRSYRYSRLTFLAELLEARIFAQRIPERIEAKIGLSDSSGHFKKMRNRSDRCVGLPEKRLNLRKGGFGARLADCVSVIVLHGTLRLRQSLLFLAETGIGESKGRRPRDHSVGRL